MGGWYGVDLDGTLAVYTGWVGPGEIGDPVPAMLERVKRWLAEGREVRVFTARVGVGAGYSPESGRSDADPSFVTEQRALIEAWCERHVGQKLAVTATKDFAMIELWDDRAVQIVTNSGQRVDGAGG